MSANAIRDITGLTVRKITAQKVSLLHHCV